MVKRLIEKHDDTFQRVFEVIPGLFIWILLTAPFWLGKTLPNVAADLLVILTVYWVYKAAEMTIGVVFGFIKYRQAIKTNWLEKINKLDFKALPDQDTLPKNSKLPKHLIAIPNGGAKYEILKPTLQMLVDQDYPLDHIYVCISTEERMMEREPEYFENMHKQMREDFKDTLGDRLMITIHPKDIPGEMVGAAANRSWAVKKAIEILEERDENIQDFIMTSPDEDLNFDPKFLAAMSYEYLIANKRTQKFYQTAVYTFNNNYWQVPILVRTFAIGVTLPVLSSSTIHERERETWSCFSVNLQLMRLVNYWDTSIGIDDTPFFWRPFFYYNGDFECRVFYVPLNADAVYHPNYIKNHRAQYKQLLRWGWGVITFPIAAKGLLTNEKIPFSTRFRKLYNMFEVFVLWKVLAYLITFGAPIIFLVSSEYQELVISHSLPETLSSMLFLAMFFLIPSTIVKMLLAPKRPKNWPLLRMLAYLAIEIPLNLVVLMTYSFLPFVEASTRMMMGHKYGFVVTPKHR